MYVAGLGPAVGKGTVALGLVEPLSRQVARIGVFRPLVADAVEASSAGLAGGHLHGADAAQCGEGDLAAEPCGLSPAATSRVAALSEPTPY